MGNDPRSRKWQITINNPVDKGYTHEYIKKQFLTFSGLLYWCMSDEIGEQGTYHTHVYIALSNATRFSSLKKKFNGAHFELANGTSAENRDYIFKVGKWLHSTKGETNLRDTHEEEGELPLERQGARNDLVDLYDMIKKGMSNFEIMEENPSYLLNIDKIERVRQIVREEKYKNDFRSLDVTYVFGSTGTGKTRDIMERYGYENVFRVTDYIHPFDGYKGQEVIVFEEFRSSLKIQDILNYLDGYPLELPCRYVNKIACYLRVYLVTNIPLEAQYSTVQVESPETWKAFLRRINKVLEYDSFGVKIEMDTQSFLKYGTGELPYQEVL